jgi:archaellum component FlaC
MEEVIKKLDAMSEKSEQNKAAIEQKLTEQVDAVKTEVASQIKVVSESIDRVKADVDAMMKKAGRL